MRRNYKRKKFHVSGICIFLETGVRTESWTAKQLIQDFACTPVGSYILMIP